MERGATILICDDEPSLRELMRLSLETGQTMVEYGFILALVAAVAVLTLVALGPDVQSIFSSVATDF